MASCWRCTILWSLRKWHVLNILLLLNILLTGRCRRGRELIIHYQGRAVHGAECTLCSLLPGRAFDFLNKIIKKKKKAAG